MRKTFHLEQRRISNFISYFVSLSTFHTFQHHNIHIKHESITVFVICLNSNSKRTSFRSENKIDLDWKMRKIWEKYLFWEGTGKSLRFWTCNNEGLGVRSL